MSDASPPSRELPVIKRHWVIVLVIFCSIVCTSALLLPAGENGYLVRNNNLGNEAERVPVNFEKTGAHYTLGARGQFAGTADQISLHIATHFSRPFISDSHIYSPDKECLWQGPKDQHIIDNSLVTWNRVKCSASYEGPLILDVQSPENVTLSIWTEKPTRFNGLNSTESPIILLRDSKHIPTGVIRHRINTEIYSKIRLISHLWGGVSATLLYLLCCIGFFLAFLAIVVSRANLPTSFFLMLMGVGFIQAVIVPPLQAPDEPSHLLGYGHLIGEASFENDLLDVARTGHFQRIREGESEKFTSKDVHRPTQDNWPSYVGATDMNSRSVVTALAWKLFGELFSSEQAAIQILLLRLFQLLFVGVIFFLASAHVKTASRPTYLFLLATTPSLAFFIMHVSNYFSAIALYLVIGNIIIFLLENHKWRSTTAIAFALASGTAVFTNASGVGLGAVIFVILALANSKNLIDKPDKLQFTIAFYITFSFWLLVKVLLSPNQDQPELPLTQILNTSELLFAAIPIAFFVNFNLLRKDIWIRKTTAPTPVILAASIIALAFFQSLLELNLLTTPNIESGQNYHALLYVFQCVVTFISDLLPSKLNFYMSQSYWFGFGWLEMMPPDWLINIIKIPFSICFVLTVTYLLSKRHASFRTIHTMLFLSILTYLAGMAYALTTRGEYGVNLHGRYMIGCYIFLAALFSHASHSYYDTLKTFMQHSRAGALAINSTPIGILISIHLFVIFFLAERYY